MWDQLKLTVQPHVNEKHFTFVFADLQPHLIHLFSPTTFDTKEKRIVVLLANQNTLIIFSIGLLFFCVSLSDLWSSLPCCFAFLLFWDWQFEIITHFVLSKRKSLPKKQVIKLYMGINYPHLLLKSIIFFHQIYLAFIFFSFMLTNHYDLHE